MGEVDHVLIVGGGIGGITSATALHQRGIDVTVVERESDWPMLGAGLSIQPNGMRVLRGLNLDTAVVQAGMTLDRWLFAQQDGEVLCDIDLHDVWGDVGPFIGIARARLQEALLTGIGSVPCRLGTSVVAIHNGESQVRVDFTDGSTGAYDLVIGADGIGSTVRQLVFGDVKATFAGQISWRSVAPVELPGPPSVQFWLGDGCFFGLCSLADRWSYGFANVTQDREYDPIEGRLKRLRNRFREFGGTVQDYLRRLESDAQVHCSSHEWVEHAQWHAGRVVLIGDAAHASSPMMGQGGSLAMEDGWVLTEALCTEPTLERALAAYVDRRAPRVKWVQEQSLAVAESLNLPASIRNEALRSKGRAKFYERYGPLVRDL